MFMSNNFFYSNEWYINTMTHLHQTHILTEEVTVSQQNPVFKSSGDSVDDQASIVAKRSKKPGVS